MPSADTNISNQKDIPALTRKEVIITTELDEIALDTLESRHAFNIVNF